MELSTKRMLDHGAKVNPPLVVVSPGVPSAHLPHRQWPAQYSVLSRRGIVHLQTNGQSSVIDQATHAQLTDMHNLAWRFPFFGKVLHAKVLRAWAAAARSVKHDRARAALARADCGVPRGVGAVERSSRRPSGRRGRRGARCVR